MFTGRRLEALVALATQDVSPEERDIAQAKLAASGQWPPPPHRPTAVAAPAPQPSPQPMRFWTFSGGTSSNGAAYVNNGTFYYVRVEVNQG